MNAASGLITIVCAWLIWTLPRSRAPIPLLVAVAWVPREAVLEIASVNFSILHLLVVCGVARVLSRGEGLAGGSNAVDRWIILSSLVLVVTSVFHSSSQWAFRIGTVWTELGCYLLFRVFVATAEDVERLFKAVCIVLLPVAMLMLLEKAAAYNFFSLLGGYSEAVIRDGLVRARGPFAHPILAGTVGAGSFPMAMYLWRSHRRYGLMGAFATLGIVFASTSSGPIMMLMFGVLGMMLWKMRTFLRAIRWSVVFSLLALNAVMNDPVYYLMARIDLTGSSKGWHRARLIESSIEHLDEWWLAGTDFTRHWMPTGVHANEVHTDITNHLLGLGVDGGLLLILIFVLALLAAFRLLGAAIREGDNDTTGPAFLWWTIGAMLFAHVLNFFSISLFDQSVVFLYLLLAATGAVHGATAGEPCRTVTHSLENSLGALEVTRAFPRPDPSDRHGRHRIEV